MIYYIQAKTVDGRIDWLTREFLGCFTSLSEAQATLAAHQSDGGGRNLRIIGVSEAYYPPENWHREAL